MTLTTHSGDASKVKTALSRTDTQRVCGKIFQKGAWAYVCASSFSTERVKVCSNCQVDDSCVICKDCWDPKKHVGHNFSPYKVSGGCCDCGDPEAWSEKGFCDVHSGHTDEEPAASLDPEFVQTVNRTAGGVVKFLSAVLCGFKNYELILWDSDQAQLTVGGLHSLH